MDGSAGRKTGTDLLGFGAALLLVALTAAIGGAFTARGVRDWYVSLDKPGWNPPSGVFGPVWAVLYFLMAAAAGLVWRRRDAARVTGPLALFAVQLVLNAAWSAVFFAWRKPGLAFLEIILLAAAIFATAWAFWRVSRAASVLLWPYLAWVLFAGALTFTIWRLNPSTEANRGGGPPYGGEKVPSVHRAFVHSETDMPIEYQAAASDSLPQRYSPPRPAA